MSTHLSGFSISLVRFSVLVNHRLDPHLGSKRRRVTRISKSINLNLKQKLTDRKVSVHFIHSSFILCFISTKESFSRNNISVLTHLFYFLVFEQMKVRKKGKYKRTNLFLSAGGAFKGRLF